MSSFGLGWSTKGLQNVCPTGVATFDRLLGGGFALSSLNLIDEDCDRVYSSMLAKAYLSAAINAGQNVIIFSSTIKSKSSRFLKELPTLQDSSDSDIDHRNPSGDSMKIAFRYSNLPSRFAANQEGEDSSSQKFDFGQNLDSSTVESANIEFYGHSAILSVLEKCIASTRETPKTSNVTRILIDEIGSPFSALPSNLLPKVFHRIKVLLRRMPNFVCLATLVPDRTTASTTAETADESSDLLNSLLPLTRERIHSHADSVVRLVGFGDEDDQDGSNPYAADYAGFLYLLRLPRLNSFAPYNPSLESTEFGIKLRNGKRYLAIEKLALPPDLGETVNRFTSSTAISERSASSDLSCANTFAKF